MLLHLMLKHRYFVCRFVVHFIWNEALHLNLNSKGKTQIINKMKKMKISLPHLTRLLAQPNSTGPVLGTWVELFRPAWARPKNRSLHYGLARNDMGQASTAWIRAGLSGLQHGPHAWASPAQWSLYCLFFLI